MRAMEKGFMGLCKDVVRDHTLPGRSRKASEDAVLRLRIRMKKVTVR